MCLGFTEHRPHSLEARPPKKSSGKAPRCLRGMRLVTPDNGAVTLAVMGNDLMREQPLKSVVEPLHEPESYGPHRAARERPSNAGGYGARRRRAGRCAKALDPHSRRDANLGVPSAPGRGFISFPHDRAAPPRQPQGGDTMALLQSLIPPLPPAVPLSCSPIESFCFRITPHRPWFPSVLFAFFRPLRNGSGAGAFVSDPYTVFQATFPPQALL